MAYSPDTPFPKSAGDIVRSKDFSDVVNEVLRLESDKVDRSGDTMTGQLVVQARVGIQTSSPSVPLEVNSGAANVSPVVGISTPGGADFIGLSGGRQSSQLPLVAWKRGPLRLGTATTFGGQGLSEKMRIGANGNVGIGEQSPGEGSTYRAAQMQSWPGADSSSSES